MMKIAITGGTGFVGRHLARALAAEGHTVVLISRGVDRRDESIRRLPGAVFTAIGTDDEDALADAFRGCNAVAHLAGINREIGSQTYQHVHVEGTRRVVNAARRAGIRRIVLLSFLRARPDCGSKYHESKWTAEQIVRAADLDCTIVKAGVIYGAGDHMLDHLSHALHTFPIFGLVGMVEKPIRPLAVQDLVRVLKASLVDGRLARQTVAVTGPEQLDLGDAVRRVAHVVGRRPVYVRLPLWMHYTLAWCFERTMKVPLVSTAQVRILSEGIVQPAGPVDPLPADLAPTTPFTTDQIRRGLPPPKAFGLEDCLCWA